MPYLETDIVRRLLIPWSRYNCRWDLGLSSQSSDKMWKHWVEDFVFTTTEVDSPKLATEVLPCVFFGKDGVIYWHVVSPYTTITTDACIKILGSLHWFLWSKCLGLACSFILPHNKDYSQKFDDRLIAQCAAFS